MLQIGITGGIGAGKSTICKIFSLLDVPVYNTDNSAKHLLNTNPDLKKNMIKLFGPNAYNTNHTFNNKFIAQKVFNNKKLLEQLNSFVHPCVADDYFEWVKKQNTPYIIKEAALLFETDSYKQLDKTILVYAPVELRINRVLERDPHRNEKQIHDIIDKQIDEKIALKKADYIIKNDDTSMVIPQVLELHKKLQAL